MADNSDDTRADNRLAQTTSPYLLQHRSNPVDWYPWNEEALSKAERENKPILLSIGYAACHWCHVMAHESFENPDIASLMNANFVNIKVDREERPDLDALYQAALQSLGEQGGWPLTMFLTPRREPFGGGTYFPPEDRYNRPGFARVLTEIARIYRDDPAKIARNADAITSGLSRLAQPAPGTPPPLADMDRMAQAVVNMIDPVLGGLRGAPKFPHVPFLTFLWHAYLRTGAQDLRHAVVTSCAAMCQGGIYDHLAGGFARYSTDDRWLAPHFEKMLYDNAQLIDLLTLVWQETRAPLLRQRVRETIAWILRDMIGEGGAFAATVDADSEGEEGKFAVWTTEEIAGLLGKDAAAFCRAYDVRPEGNWEGKTILNRSRNSPFGTEEEEAALTKMRAVLLAARDRRVAPERDDKILADWNGLAIAAIARAGAVFDDPAWIEAARKAFDFVYMHMQPEGRLVHALRLGRIGAAGLIDDHAAMARAALSLHAATGLSDYLDGARKWVDDADRLFWDSRAGPSGGGYFLAAEDAEDLLVRAKSPFDNATPAGNNIMLGVLAKLHLLTGAESYRHRADALARAFAGPVEQRVIEMATYLAGIALLQSGLQIVIVGAVDDSDTLALLAAACAVSLPDHVLMRTSPADILPEGHPAAGKGPIEGRATAYVCQGPVCSTPVTDPAALRAKLLALRAA